MALNKRKRRFNLRKIFNFIACSSCFKCKELDNDAESEDNNCGDDNCDEDDGNSEDDGNDDGDDDGNGEDGSNNEEEGDSDADKEDETNSDDDVNIYDDRNRDIDIQSDNSEVDVSNNEYASSSYSSILNNVDDIIVTRVYASASARNIVKHHSKIFPRSESDTNINNYVNNKVKRRPNKKYRNDSEWQIPSTNREVRIGRWLYFHSEIDIEEDADTDMLADGELLFEDGPDNHVTAENGDMGNWDVRVYIG